MPDAAIEARFEILGRVGRGSFGEVFRAVDRTSGEVVAIKRLHAHLEDATARERFERESRLLSRVSSAHVVRYVAHGVDARGAPCLVVEWLEGEDLAQRRKRAPLSGVEITMIARQIALGLEALHAEGIVHRDVKPSNVYLVDGSGAAPTAKLIDLGVAHATTEATLTTDGVAIGTPFYMSPEQARGDDLVTPRSDLFSLGVVLYELCAGVRPFRGDDLFAVLAKIVLADPPRLADAMPNAPRELLSLVDRAMSKSPLERFGTARELADALATLPPFVAKGQVPEGSEEPTAIVAAASGSLELRVVTAVFAKLPPTLDDAATKGTFTRIAKDAGAEAHMLLGPNVVAVFGGDRTKGDEVERAARAALSLRSELLGVRVAIATGRALSGSGALAGDVIERGAAELEHARAGVVLVDAATARMLREGFEITEREGRRRLVSARARNAPSTPPPSMAIGRTLLGRSTPCVGRDRELAALTSLFAECRDESVARAALVTGGPGAGKSRLRHELCARIGHEASLLLVGRSDPFAVGSAFGLVGGAIRRHACVVDGEPRDEQLASIDASIGLRLPKDKRADVVARIAEIAGVAAPDRGRVADAMLAADRMRNAWLAWLDAESRAGVVVLVLEDLHAGDVPSVRLVDAALQTLAERPILVVALARPEVAQRFPDLWAERALLRMPLPAIAKRAGERLVRAALGDAADAALVARIVERADGNPFFLEELIRAVAEQGPEAALPDTVLGVVQARLDALGREARRTLRAASVFGEAFWRSGVMRVLGGGNKLAETAVDELGELARREVVTQRAEARFPGEEEFQFRHAIVRDAAYATFTDEDRAQAHRLAAAWLEQVGERDGLALAEHHERAGDAMLAARHYLAAAEQALRGGDFDSAIARAERVSSHDDLLRGRARLVAAEAYRWKGRLDDASSAAVDAAELLTPGSAPWFHAIRETIAAAGRLGAMDVVEVWAFESVRAIAEEGAGGAQLASLPVAASHMMYSGRYAVAEALTARVEELFAASPDADPLVEARVHQLRAMHASHREDIETSLAEQEAALASFERAGDRRNATLTRSNLGFALAQVGDLAEAEAILRAAYVAAHEMRLPTIWPLALHNLGLVLSARGLVEEALDVEQRAVDAFAALKDPRLEGASRVYLSRILFVHGDFARAAAEAQAVLESGATGGLRIGALAASARAKLRLGEDVGEAAARAKEAMELAGEHGVEEFEPLARIARVESLEAAGERDEARRVAKFAADCLRMKAAALRDKHRREQFLALPDHARLLELAR